MNNILIYFLIGLFIGSWLWHEICKAQTEEEKNEENPSIIIALPCLIFFWPVGLISYIHSKLS